VLLPSRTSHRLAVSVAALTLLAASPLSAQRGSSGAGPRATTQVESRPQWGLRTTSFATDHGKVTVYLPDEVAAGDTLSGTVTLEPAGDRQRQVRKNTGELSGYVVDVGGTESSAGGGRVDWTVPADLAGAVVPLVLRDAAGHAVASTEIPVVRRPPILSSGGTGGAGGSGYDIPRVGQTGRPFRIAGSFDGDLGTTGISIGGHPSDVLAESPRQVVVRAPANLTGPTDVMVTEGDAPVASGTTNLLGVSLSAPTVHLERGQRTVVTVAVEGLDGLPASAYPVYFEVVNRSPQVVRLQGVEDQRRVLTLGSHLAGDDGTYRWSVPVTGVAVGRFAISAFVFADWPLGPAVGKWPFPGEKPITCLLGGGGDEGAEEGSGGERGEHGEAERPETGGATAEGGATEAEPAAGETAAGESAEETAEVGALSGAGYDFVKEGFRPLDQHHRPEWGERWCAPTATATSLAWFAAHGLPDLVPDPDGDGIDEADLYRVVESLADLSHTTAEAGTFPYDWLSGLYRYLAEHGLADDFHVKVFEAAGDPSREIDGVVGRYRGKEREVEEQIGKLGAAIEAKRKEIEEKQKQLDELKAQEEELKKKREGTSGEEREALDREIGKVIDAEWPLSDAVEAGRSALAALSARRSQWQTLRDQLDHWDAMKSTQRYIGTAPDFANYTSELEAGEDVILRIALPEGTHVLVGQAFAKEAEEDGTWKAALVDPATGKSIETHLREQGGALEVLYRGAWRRVATLLSVSPVAK